MTLKNIPAVSIIIPMYNAEKYIGECLDSILAQTFQDFEVIVVDDCSTDESYAIVESYLSKFNTESEKLKLLRLPKNSGAPGIPNNKGLSIARGDYIYFLEADDMITETALEELYPIAKKFDADVVQCENFFIFTDDKTKCTVSTPRISPLPKNPILITNDLMRRIQYLRLVRFYFPVWLKLIRHDFITKNGLQMIDANAHDANYTFCLVLSAERYICVPNAVNFYRVVENSMSHEKIDDQKTIAKWVNTLTKGFKCLDEFWNDKEGFKEHPDIKFIVLEIWVGQCFHYLKNIYANTPLTQLDDMMRKAFEKVELNPALTSFLFNRMNMFELNFNNREATIQQLQEQVKQLQQS